MTAFRCFIFLPIHLEAPSNDVKKERVIKPSAPAPRIASAFGAVRPRRAVESLGRCEGSSSSSGRSGGIGRSRACGGSRGWRRPLGLRRSSSRAGRGDRIGPSRACGKFRGWAGGNAPAGDGPVGCEGEDSVRVCRRRSERESALEASETEVSERDAGLE